MEILYGNHILLIMEFTGTISFAVFSFIRHGLDLFSNVTVVGGIASVSDVFEVLCKRQNVLPVRSFCDMMNINNDYRMLKH